MSLIKAFVFIETQKTITMIFGTVTITMVFRNVLLVFFFEYLHRPCVKADTTLNTTTIPPTTYIPFVFDIFPQEPPSAADLNVKCSENASFIEDKSNKKLKIRKNLSKEVKQTSNQCSCEGFYSKWNYFNAGDVNLEELHYYKVVLNCRSRQPFKELVSYYKIVADILKHSLVYEKGLDWYCASYRVINFEKKSKSTYFCELYYKYGQRKKHVFKVKEIELWYLRAKEVTIEVTELVQTTVWNEISKTR